MGFATLHCIAGLVFSSQANIPLPGLLALPFTAFAQPDSSTPDIRHQILKIYPEAQEAAPLSQSAHQALLAGAAVENGAFESPLLRAAPVAAYLQAALEHPKSEMHLTIQADRVIGRDFADHTLHLFYLEGEDNRAPRFAQEAPAEEKWVFQITPLSASPMDAPPLLPGERQALARGVQFVRPEAAEHPLLRLEPLRSWLLECARQGERVGIDLYLDGVVALNESRRSMTYFYQPEFYLGGSERLVGEEMRRIFASFLPDFDAWLVHCGGLIYDGKAAIFLAPDEGGKSTALRLAQGVHYLNDDQVILRRQGSGFFAHATPLGKLTSGPAQAPLGGLFFLQKDASFKLEALKPAEAVQALWNEYRLYAAFQPRERKMAAFDLIDQACHQAPLYRLHFARQHIDWEAVGAAMQGKV